MVTVNERFSDFRPSGNQATRPDVYELENQAIDPDGLVWGAMRQLAPWAGRVLVDLGCGNGFWLGRYADQAAEVIGIEPDPDLAALARARDMRTRVVEGSAEHIPLRDSSVDVIHARFAYFFPPGCDAGLSEVRRVLRPRGRLVVVDNDYRHGQFAHLLTRSAWAARQGQAETTDAWWGARHAARVEVMSEWRFDHRADLESVLHLEFPDEIADAWLREHPRAIGLSYGYVIFAVGGDDT